jgi:hypothetical protein
VGKSSLCVKSKKGRDDLVEEKKEVPSHGGFCIPWAKGNPVT